MYRWLLLVAVVLAALAGLMIGVLNPDPVTVQLAVLEPTMALGAMILVTFGIGVFAGLALFWLLFDLPARFRRQRRASAASLPNPRPGDE